MRSPSSSPRTGSTRRALEAGRGLRALAVLGLVVAVSSCVTVRPEQRAILADEIMQFGANSRAQAALDHALENREGSAGGGSVQGGGCGCN